MAAINYYENSDLLKSSATILCHQVNCMGVMGSGIAKTIKDKFPNVFESYRQRYESGQLVLGDCQIIPISNTQYVANLAGQKYYGREPNTRYTSYDGLYNALEKLAHYVKTNNVKSIAFPYKFGCDRGGASWNIVSGMIEEAFRDLDILIEIHALGKTDIPLDADLKDEYILCAAIMRKEESTAHHCYHEKYNDIYKCEVGWRHPDILYKFLDELDDTQQGFLTSKCRYVSRQEAAEIAYKAGQTRNKKTVLYSEDLY